MYQIGQWASARRDFENVFKTTISPFYDGLATIVFQAIKIDILLFDEWLHKMYGDYEDEGKSMQDIVIEHYGYKADELINELL
jgi:hypothetical protein